MSPVFQPKFNLGSGERETFQGSADRLPRTVTYDHVTVHISHGLIAAPEIDSATAGVGARVGKSAAGRGTGMGTGAQRPGVAWDRRPRTSRVGALRVDVSAAPRVPGKQRRCMQGAVFTKGAALPGLPGL